MRTSQLLLFQLLLLIAASATVALPDGVGESRSETTLKPLLPPVPEKKTGGELATDAGEWAKERAKTLERLKARARSRGLDHPHNET